MNEIKTRILESIVNYSLNTAIISPKIALTYSEINNYIKLYTNKINEICHTSIKNKYVLIYMRSPLEEIIAQMTVLINGGICVPLDKNTPLGYYSLERIENIVCMITDDYEFNEQINFPIIYLLIKISRSTLFVLFNI